MSQLIVSLQVRDNQYQQLVPRQSQEIIFFDKEICSTIPLLRMEIVNEDRVRIFNLSEQTFYSGEETLQSGAAIESSLPFQLESDFATVFVSDALDRELFYSRCERISSGLSESDRPGDTSTTSTFDLPVVELARSPSPFTLSRWFSTLALIQRQASCSDAFYRESVAALVNPGGLETSMLLERGDSGWSVKHFEAVNAKTPLYFRPELAELVFRRRETVMYHPTPADLEDISAAALANASLGASYAAPIFDEDMHVAYILYGNRQLGPTNRRRRIRDLEARWIQLVAEAVSAGLVRLRQESSLARQRWLLERSYPSEIVDQLASQRLPRLAAEDREVTVMFIDLVGSSKLCGSGSSPDYLAFQSEAMDCWTSIIGNNDGTVVDYYGDGLIAMWNAPNKDTNHAELACKAGLAILQELSALNAKWEKRLGGPIAISIGAHTGTASVGNAGSNDRLKYGPRGAVVNLASRIEHATRTVQQQFLISDATRQQLPKDAAAFRLGQFQIRGFDDPVVLHAIHSLGAEPPTNSCCLAKHCQLQHQLQHGDVVGASDYLANCQSCQFDDLSLQFIHKQLTDILEESKEACSPRPPLQIGTEPVFDLRRI